jgi:hypothetical protein
MASHGPKKARRLPAHAENGRNGPERTLLLRVGYSTDMVTHYAEIGRGVDQPTAIVKSVATDSALRAVVVKITAQIQLSFANATASARLALRTVIRFTLVLMTCSREHR